MLFHAILLGLTLSIFGVDHVRGEIPGKRGAAYNDVATASQLSQAGTVRWAYNWKMSAEGTLPSDVEYVPMLKEASFDGWQTSVESALADGSKYILGFNEPDYPTQACLSPSEAADYFKQYITPFQGRAKLVSPAVTSSTDAGKGLKWLDAFMKACSSCEISVIAVHWYGDSFENFKTFVSEAVTQAKKSYRLSEVWVTEFALNADVNGVTQGAEAFIQDATSWLDSQPAVTRYSYFMCAEGYLLSGRSLNNAGHAYVNVDTSSLPTWSSSSTLLSPTSSSSSSILWSSAASSVVCDGAM
jgi:hypothetical protein